MLSVNIYEYEDVEIALDELAGQIDLNHDLDKHSVGIITCYYKFCETGVLKAICQKLPFSTIGAMTIGNGGAGESDVTMLNLTILTGDEVSFATSCTGALDSKDYAETITDTFRRAADTLSGKPGLIISFFPLLSVVSGDDMLKVLNEVAENVPIVGGVASRYITAEDEKLCTIYNGEYLEASVSMLLIAGNIKPSFFVGTISQNNVQKHKAVITDSTGNLIRRVNDMVLVDYMKSLGLSEGNGIEGSAVIPFIVDKGDGVPMVRAILQVTPEGYAICGGAMPQNATLAIGNMSREDVLKTSQQSIREALATGKKNGALIISCVSRSMIMGLDIVEELDSAKTVIGDQIPYMAMYALGEMCPVYDCFGYMENRFHNFTFSICIF